MTPPKYRGLYYFVILFGLKNNKNFMKFVKNDGVHIFLILFYFNVQHNGFDSLLQLANRKGTKCCMVNLIKRGNVQHNGFGKLLQLAGRKGTKCCMVGKLST